MDIRHCFLLLLVVRGATTRNPCVCGRKAHMRVNECEDPSLNDCDPNATCTDLPSGFSCTCNPGFDGNGTFCVELCAGTPCVGENRQCFGNQVCTCKPGFNLEDGICIESCDELGSTFITYQGMELSCSPFLGTIILGTLAECINTCRFGPPNCLSLVYSQTSDECSLFGCDPLTAGASFSTVSDTTFTLTRNCA